MYGIQFTAFMYNTSFQDDTQVTMYHRSCSLTAQKTNPLHDIICSLLTTYKYANARQSSYSIPLVLANSGSQPISTHPPASNREPLVQQILHRLALSSDIHTGRGRRRLGIPLPFPILT